AGVEQGHADGAVDAGLVQGGAGGGGQPGEGLLVIGAVVQVDAEDDLAGAGAGLEVEQLVEPAVLGGHDPAVRVGCVDLAGDWWVGGGGLRAGGRGGQGVGGLAEVGVLVGGDRAGAGDPGAGGLGLLAFVVGGG